MKVQKSMEVLRQKIILDFFLRHFLEMAQCASQFRAHRLIISYTKHIERLISVMNDVSITNDDANEMNQQIQTLRSNAIAALSNENTEPPKLPRRESTVTIDAKEANSNGKKKNPRQLKVGINRYTNIDTPVTPVIIDDNNSRDYRKNRMDTPTIEEEKFEFTKSNQIVTTEVMVHQMSTPSQDNVNISLDELLGNVRT
jgi:hypothetical protein